MFPKSRVRTWGFRNIAETTVELNNRDGDFNNEVLLGRYARLWEIKDTKTELMFGQITAYKRGPGSFNYRTFLRSRQPYDEASPAHRYNGGLPYGATARGTYTDCCRQG